MVALCKLSISRRKRNMAAFLNSRGNGCKVLMRISSFRRIQSAKDINRKIFGLNIVSRAFSTLRTPPLQSGRCFGKKRLGEISWSQWRAAYVPAMGSRGFAQDASNNAVNEILQGSTPLAENPFVTNPTEAGSTSIDIVQGVAGAVNAIGEPTLASMGLGGTTPIGLVQHALEMLHTTVGLPWVWSIVAATIAFRTLMFPLIVKSQANAARLNNVKPELEEVQAQLRDLMNSNNAIGKAAASARLQQLYKDNDCHPIKSIIAPLVQVPLFISFFVGLRRMANLPVESFKEGGLFWFTDLTAYDPYFVLPIVCSLTMLASIELGGEAGVSNPQMQHMKTFFRVMCVAMIPLTAQFPAAIFTYWVTSNLFSLGQVSLLKVKAVREYFGIPEMKVHKNLPAQGGFWENMSAGYKNAKEEAYVKHHEKMKRQKEKALGTAPLETTYEHNPRIKHNQEVFAAAKRKKGKDRINSQAAPPM
ncbi:mitochondrial inner membrane protein OXA1L isoform X2 [Nematostella vectensis]|uniref:mitochondrial inner membrane protein OXA1L isoform X2 n=1 Tax=Nematostella vectensis TaxID=45351 RepID=UPI0020775E02|nr:mitochondrial inner membrane protein OXA1L isoform X2 [Nematostella vectensis]